MKQNTSQTIRRAENFPVILIGEGILVGIIGGMVVFAYRLALSYAGTWMNAVTAWAKGNGMRMAFWFLLLAVMAVVVGKLVRWEPMISGSGIPQLEGEMTGKLNQVWWRVLPAKFAGGFLSLFAGLSLGREGPSIQLGAMTGKGIAKAMKCGKTEEKFLLTCGASAGLSAAFHAPLAGVMFSLEEVHKNFSVSVLISVMAASLTADLISSGFLGIEPVFDFSIGNVLPHRYYWLIVLLGILLGVFGAFYNWFTLKVQELYRKPKFLKETGRLLIPFMLAGVLAFSAPGLLGSGHELIMALTGHEYALGMILFIFIMKFIFSGLSFGSGAPGGIFFPLLVLGAFIGGIFGMVGVNYFGMDMDYVNNFILLAMAGCFTAIVRAPLTGIILIFEMTGSVSQMLSLSIVSIVAYVAATLLKSTPIYESLLERQLERNGQSFEGETGNKLLGEYVIMHGSCLENRSVRDIDWPEHSLIVAVQRGERELIPHGDTVLGASDTIVTLTNEEYAAEVNDRMQELCGEQLF